MNTKEIAEKLVTWFNAGEMEKPYVELYSQDIVSIESGDSPFKICNGMDELLKKSEFFMESVEMHGASASEALVADDWFSVAFTIDSTNKETGQRTQSSEIAVYQVKDGKIIREEFFYNPEM